MVGVTTFKQFTIGLIAFKIIHGWVDAFKQFTVGVHAFEINHDWGRCVQHNPRCMIQISSLSLRLKCRAGVQMISANILLLKGSVVDGSDSG